MLGLHVSISHSLARLFGIGALVSLALVACADHRPVGPLRDGDLACQEIVAHCHDPSALGEPYRSCYDTGIRGDGDVCLTAHDDCIKSCTDAPASAGEGGEGGHGEAGSSNTAGGPGVNAGGGGVSGTDGTAETGGVAESAGTGAVTATGGAAEAGHAGN